MSVEHFGQTGTIGDLYAHHGIDIKVIVEAADRIALVSLYAIANSG